MNPLSTTNPTLLANDPLLGNGFNGPSPSTIASAGSSVNNLTTPQATPAPTVATKQPSLLERLLPMGGGILGGILGGALAPETGGLSLAIPALLAGAGGAVGKAGENAVTGQKVLQPDVLEQGALQGAGQLAGMGLAKGLGAVGSTLASKAASTTAAEADAADFAPYEAVAKGTNLQGIQNLFRGQLGTDMSPSTVHNVTDILTGPNGFINGQKVAQIADSGPVNIDGVMDNVKSAIGSAENTGELGDVSLKGTPGNNLYNAIVNKFQNLTPDQPTGPLMSSEAAGYTIPQAGDASKVFDDLQATQKQIASLRGAMPGTIQGATKNVLQSYYNELLNRLGNTSGLNEAIAKYTVSPEDEQALRAAVAAKGLPDSVADYGINSLNNAKTLSDIRSTEAPLVEADNAADMADKYQAGPGVVKGAKSAVKSNLMNNPLKLAADAAGAYGLVKGKPLDALPALLLAAGGNPTALMTAGNVLGSAGTSTGAGLLGSLGQVVAGAKNTVPNTPADASNMINLNQGSSMNPPTSLAEQALMEALGNPLNGGLSQLGTLVPEAQKANTALIAAQNIANAFNTAGGAQGPAGGLLAKLGSLFTGGPAAQYGAQAKAAEQQLQGVGINAPAPQITQNQTAAQLALTNINNLLNALTMPQNQGSTLSQVSP